MSDDLYTYVHIPRTGGTFFINSLPDYLSRENDDFLKHYHYVGNYSSTEYFKKHIPRLSARTKQQQLQCKFITGHSMFSNSHKWFRTKKNIKLIATIRHPIDRLLSSFNFRYQSSVLLQENSVFTNTTPALNVDARTHEKTAQEYNTLWEFYQDNVFERNLQCKWIIKTFLHYDKNEGWIYHDEYIPGPDVLEDEEQMARDTWPVWMFSEHLQPKDTDWFEFAMKFTDKFWWIGKTSSLELDMRDFCVYTNTNMKVDAEKNISSKIQPYWTMDDVMAQPDINELLEAERFDLKLFEQTFKRPF
jgi:hypothetical protein